MKNPELTIEQKNQIISVFYQDIEPKLVKLQARTGTINCNFAGNDFIKWSIVFGSRGTGFEILDFEYDEKGTDFDLDL